MKKNLLFGLALAASVPAFAASPYQGSEAADKGSYYLYQVESGKWLQANMSQIDNWTTHAELGEVGFDVELRKLDGFEGFQIFCFATNNGELNGSDEDRFYLDQGDRALCDWIFEPVDVDGVSNAYKIMIKAKPDADNRSRIETDRYIGYNPNTGFGGLSDDPESFTWQLVSRADRLAWMQNEVENGPVDASWLIPWFDRGRNDMRDRLWIQEWAGGSGNALDGTQGYPVQEKWNNWTGKYEITLQDLPEGTYSFSVQAFHRDASIDDEGTLQRFLNGTDNLDRVKYYAGAAEGNVMSIFAEPETDNLGLRGEWRDFADKGGPNGVPNNMEAASRLMHVGHYINEYITTPVTDGTLTIGIRKTDRADGDWLISKRWYLRYDSKTAGAEDLSGLQARLQELIDEAKTLPETPTFGPQISAAEKALEEATTSSALQEAISTFESAVSAVRNAKNDINAFNATVALGFTDAEAQSQFDSAVTRDDYGKAIKTLRYARRVSLAETHEDVFEGCEPVDGGKYYLYNVGRKQFLQGGSDWGAHAALGMPGVELTFAQRTDQDHSNVSPDYKGFIIQTGLHNGGAPHDYFTSGGYLDGDANGGSGGFIFIPIEEGSKTYVFAQADWDNNYAAWNPYGRVDGNNADETNVCTETHYEGNSFAEWTANAAKDPNAQWKLVTRDQRDALLAAASEDNPVDVSYYIKSPNVNQRENADQVWTLENFAIWGRYGDDNRNSFNFELWNRTGSVGQLIDGLPAGKYIVSCQGLYRNGTHKHGDDIDGSGPLQGQAYLPAISNAYLYGGNDNSTDVALPNILSESGKAPGEGADLKNEDTGVVYHIPEYCDQIQNFVRYGLYKAQTTFDWNPKSENEGMPIGVYVDEDGAEPGCWTVVDNFRLYYLGDGKTDAVEAIGEETVKDGKIYNLQGIEVKNPTAPGIYIQNGKKFVVTK